MNIKAFKKSLIRYAKTQLPEEYKKVLRVPTTSTTENFTLRSTKTKEVREFCQNTFGNETKSFKINRKESLFGEEVLESFLADLSKEKEEVTDIFPQYTEEQFLELEKSRIRKNLKLAFTNPKSEVYKFLEKAKEAGLINTTTMNTKQQIWEDFLKAWPLERVKSMQLEEYTNLEREDSFCYWIEKHTERLGSIWGGSAYKFGIFKMKNLEPDKRSGYLSDGDYKWVGKFGEDRDSAFSKIKAELINIIEAAQSGNLDVADNSSLGHMFKWKVAALYNKQIPHIYAPKAVNFLIKFFGKSASGYPERYQQLANEKEPGEDIIKLSERLWGIFSKNNQEAKEDDLGQTGSSKFLSLNRILFGPPGTGKTYNTISEAVKIVNPGFYKKHYEDRDSLKEEFNRLLIKDWEEPKGRIAFCTFHQSYSYEDFVEGIKPKSTDEKQVYYEIEDGIFKRICQLSQDAKKARQIKRDRPVSMSGSEYEQAQFYKVSLGDSSKDEGKDIYDYCIKNNVIAIGFGELHDLTGKSESEIKQELKEEPFSAQQLNYFIHYLQKDNYVVVSYGNRYVRALGKVSGDYFYKEDSPILYSHFRPVEWIFVNENIPVNEVYDRNFQQQTIYKLDNNGIKKDFFVDSENLTHVKGKDEETEIENRYVLIIDEINRGNVSSIFGELITLLEEDKRADGDEPLEVILPYSKKPFQVPSNIYILGTMNTADRSIEALDTALRRRFTFDEMPPDYEALINEKADKIDNIDIVKMLRNINDRIEILIDKDHKIGHSYFISISTFEELKVAFENKVLPLLQEYFFGDIGKIGLVLGSSFIRKKKDKTKLLDFTDYDPDLRSDLDEKPIFEITSPDDWNEESFTSIYK